MGLRVALKYCGGCDPAFDRTALFEAVKAAAGEDIDWRRPEEDDYEAMLLICGCRTACPLEKYEFKIPPLVVRDLEISAAQIAAQLIGSRT